MERLAVPVPTSVRVLAVVATGAVTLGACSRPSKPAVPTTDPYTWVRPDGHRALWGVWADLRDLAGEEAWEARGYDWLERKALDDLGSIDDDQTFLDPFVIGGVHRFGLADEQWRAMLVKFEPEQPEDGGLTERLRDHWRARWVRWADERVAAGEERAVVEALARAWQRAFDEDDLALFGACAELARGDVPGFDPRALDGWDESGWDEDEARQLAHDLLGWHAQRWSERFAFDAVLDLIEAYGVPESIELEPLLQLARDRHEELWDATIPLPHPYDVELAVVRFELLVERAR